MKYVLCILLLVAILAAPSTALTEDMDTLTLSRVLYTLARNESEETQLMVGTVILNRLDSPWYPDTLSEVLSQTHQFACGSRYDERSLEAARALLAGYRALPEEVVALCALDASALPEEEPWAVSGNYAFYTE